MAPSREIDDATSAATSTFGDDSVTENRRGGLVRTLLTTAFKGFERDAMGAVHRAWAACVVFMVLFFVFAIIEGEGEIMSIHAHEI